MLNLFGGRSCGCNDGGDYSTILWFIILFLLLFLNNDNCGCQRKNDCC